MEKYPSESTTNLVARKTLMGFLVTFTLLRILVYLIMSKSIPNSYVFLDGIHIHHFNEGIIMLALIAGYMLFFQPTESVRSIAALIYGVALALTFDEFGMWLNLDATYWQHMSVEIIFIIASFLGLFAYAPPKRTFTFKKCILLVILLCIYFVSARIGGEYLREHYAAKLHQLPAFSS